MKLTDVTLNIAKVDEGEWRDVPGDEDNLRFFLCGRRSRAYQDAQNKAVFRAQRTLGRKRQDLMKAMRVIDNECVAEHCLLGWENFLDGKGKPIPYSAEFAKELMTQRKYEPFQEIVKDLVDQIDAGYDDAEEEVVEKS